MLTENSADADDAAQGEAVIGLRSFLQFLGREPKSMSAHLRRLRIVGQGIYAHGTRS